jgi:hypothetical protein
MREVLDEALGDVKPLSPRRPTSTSTRGAAPFFLALGLTRGAYIGTEAASALTMHLTKIAPTAPGNCSPPKCCCSGSPSPLRPCSAPGPGKKIVGRISDRIFVLLVEIGLIAAGVLFLLGL